MKNGVSTARRLDRVAAIIRSIGCATCRAWGDTVLAEEDGTADRPERCPGCGRQVPIQVRVCIVGVPLSAL